MNAREATEEQFKAGKKARQVLEEERQALEEETKLCNGVKWNVWSDLAFIPRFISNVDISTFVFYLLGQPNAPNTKEDRPNWVSRFLDKQIAFFVESGVPSRPSVQFYQFF
jgi:hypothetical protein